MPNCGKCCEQNTVLVWGMEVEYIASFVLGNHRRLKEVIDRSEEWLRTRSGPILSPKQRLADPKKTMERIRATYGMRCPYLLEDHSCLIHHERPIACRSYGVTHFPYNCLRPYGKGESGSVRAYNSGVGMVIKQSLTELLVSAAVGDPKLAEVGFLPTLVLSRLAAPRFAGLVDSGMVDPSKLIRNHVTSPALIFQDQLPTFTLAGDEALQEVEKTGIPTGPLTLVIGGRR